MASLPSNTFLINYNARFYDPTTHTIPKTQGQLFDYDMVLNAAASSYTSDHITVNGQYFNVELASTGANPFNLTTASPFTIIAKTSRGLDSTGEHTIASCRAGGLNWILFNPGNNSGVDKVFMHNSNRYATGTPFVTITSEPNIYAIRINNGSGYGQSFTDNTTERSIAVNYNGTSTRFGIFTDTFRMGGFEIWRGDFYWIYISKEALTDNEIQQVIDYNENASTFETDVTTITASYNSTTSAVTLTAEEDMAWTASTSNDWITLSTTGGTGSSVFTVSVAANKAYTARNGLVTLTNGEDVIEITVEQAKYPLLIPNENIYRADLEVVKGYRSGSTINKAYRSGELIYYKLNYPEPTPPTPQEQPLTFNIISSGTIYWKASNSAFTTTIEYSKDNGETWTSITSNTGSSAPTINVNAGDTVQFRGNNATYSSDNVKYNLFSGSTAMFEIEGNIMSLIDSTGYTSATTLASSYTFHRLFYNCTGLTSAENLVLPATTLESNCYRHMFAGCTSLTTVPALQATTLAYGCYNSMFQGCTSLTTAPSILPATTLADYCYNSMFSGCTSITTAPELSATTLAINCYTSMFKGCTSLITAPELPATTLARDCYSGMFSGCTSLTTAPELPATTLVQYCYQNMFRVCPSLNYIKCLATNISASNCTSNWVNGVAATGTFVKNLNMSGWSRGVSGIPSGWTVQNA